MSTSSWRANMAPQPQPQQQAQALPEDTIVFDDVYSVSDFRCCSDCRQPLLDSDAHAHLCPNAKAFARKSNKADREKLRREKINEQFTELASALDPDRPKSDKASILIESIQVVKELRAELKRLQDEHTVLLDESQELSGERNELKEEKMTLKIETDQLQERIQQQLQAMSSWMMMEPSVMMSAASFPYPIPVAQMPSHVPSSNTQQRPLTTSDSQTPPVMHRSLPTSDSQTPPVMHHPFFPVPTIGTFPVHAGMHNPYIQLPSYCSSFNCHSHVERPFAQYPTQMHPCMVQMQAQQGSPFPATETGKRLQSETQSQNGLSGSSKLDSHIHNQSVPETDGKTSECKNNANVAANECSEVMINCSKSENSASVLASTAAENAPSSEKNADGNENDVRAVEKENNEQACQVEDTKSNNSSSDKRTDDNTGLQKMEERGKQES